MTTLPAAGCFTDVSQTNLGAKQAQDDILAFVAQLPGGAARTTLTIASGAVVPTSGLHQIDTEGAAAADDLANITATNLPDGSLLLLSCVYAGRVVTLKHGAGGSGQILLLSGADVALTDPANIILLQRIGSDWVERVKMGTWGMMGLPTATAGGTADALTASFTPKLVLSSNPLLLVKATAANATTTPTLAADGGTARTITKHGGQALAIGDIPRADFWCLFAYDATNARYEMLNPAPAALSIPVSVTTPTRVINHQLCGGM